MKTVIFNCSINAIRAVLLLQNLNLHKKRLNNNILHARKTKRHSVWLECKYTYSYAFSETFILPGMPVVSVLLVRLTVLPNKQ